jgi:hypothetical protein
MVRHPESAMDKSETSQRVTALTPKDFVRYMLIIESL